VLNDFDQLLQMYYTELLTDRLKIKLRNRTRMRVWETGIRMGGDVSHHRYGTPLRYRHLSQAVSWYFCFNAVSQGKSLWWQGLVVGLKAIRWMLGLDVGGPLKRHGVLKRDHIHWATTSM